MANEFYVRKGLIVSGSSELQGDATFQGTTTFNVVGIENTLINTGGAGPGTINFDVLTQPIVYYSGSATGNFTLNFRGNASTALNAMMDAGQTVTVALFNKTGATPYSASVYQIDGTPVTPLWLGGSVPPGYPNRVDIYSYSITKTANAEYVVFASQATYG